MSLWLPAELERMVASDRASSRRPAKTRVRTEQRGNRNLEAHQSKLLVLFVRADFAVPRLNDCLGFADTIRSFDRQIVKHATADMFNDCAYKHARPGCNLRISPQFQTTRPSYSMRTRHAYWEQESAGAMVKCQGRDTFALLNTDLMPLHDRWRRRR